MYDSNSTINQKKINNGVGGVLPKGLAVAISTPTSLNLSNMKRGAVLFARKTIDSDVFFWKPDKWFKIWFYLVSRMNHTANNLFERGENFVTYKEISNQTKASKGQIDKFMRWAKKEQMLTTRQTTRGMKVCVNKYWFYQDFSNYKVDAVVESKSNHSRTKVDTITNNDNNETIKQNIRAFPFKDIWDKYPKKLGRKQAERHFGYSIKTKKDFEDIQTALNNYLKSERVAKGYVQNGATWFNNWQDWVDFTETLCAKCKGKGKYTSSTGYMVRCTCPAGVREK